MSQDDKPKSPTRLSGDRLPAVMPLDEQIAEGLGLLRSGIRNLQRLENGYTKMMELQEELMLNMSSLLSSQEKRDKNVEASTREVQNMKSDLQRLQNESQKTRQYLDEQIIAFQQLTISLENFTKAVSRPKSQESIVDELHRLPAPAPAPSPNVGQTHQTTIASAQAAGYTPSQIKELRERASRGDDMLEEFAQMGLRIAEQRAGYEAKLEAQKAESKTTILHERAQTKLAERKARIQMIVALVLAAIGIVTLIVNTYYKK